ncbi:putative nucleotidyltransferase substrate binding domain-containing protein [uncultured Thiohalocapsa sp.]|uniref:putative nucleotidyltransferase substrate binding domain-containing protein n=1 Tax=uncultured Thiohalocapsa sp. TaxID=768990 RepID=UPI0025F2C024|nr:putative nucleotidyltransferase substrate binding domain-containing protein [uncultured Thiohalocapsa sp.]
MKTASIAHRVVDFLRRWPPFQYFDDDELFALVSGGRVVFHERDELVFMQGATRKPYVYVVQQGAVQLCEQSADGTEQLRDVRGEGDLLGIGRYLGFGEHIYTARTETDVILYALPAEAFWETVKHHPRASRFLATYFSVAILPPVLEVGEERGDALRLGRRPVDWLSRPVDQPARTLSCQRDTAARDVARRLAERDAAAAVVVDAQGAPLGIITPRVLSDRVASGREPPDTPAEVLMRRVCAVTAPGLEAGDYLARMLDQQTDHLVLTANGRLDGPFAGVLTRRDLTRVEGAAPLALIEDMARAPRISELAALRRQAEAVLAAGLTGPDATRWLAPMAGAFNAAVLRRVVGLVEGALAEQGLEHPGLDHCWVFFGAAARNELFTRHDLDVGLIYDDPDPDRARTARAYYLELGRRVGAALSACGFDVSAKAISPGHATACRSVHEWERAFTDWIAQPIESCVYRATSLFDMRPVQGDCRLVDRLESHIQGEEDRHPEFVPLLLEDSMANLPPLTFFRGLVVDDEGGYREVLDLQRATLQPVVDIARALALDCGRQAPTTLERLQVLSPEDDAAALLIEETAAAFRNALYHRARTGYTAGSDGSRVDPSKLTRLEQNLLKSGFRTVLRLMEYTGRRYGLMPRR